MTIDVDDALWSALGDPTRRRLVDLLLEGGPSTATALSARLPVTRQAVTKHLTVLERTGLASSQAVGREKRYVLDEDQLHRAVAQFGAVRDAWDGRLQRIKRIAERIEADAARRERPA